MPKQKLFEDESDEEVTIKTENAYAKKYDTWREKEEIHKLEQKYGPKALNSDASVSSDSEDESDEPPEISEEVEEQFLKTLSLLKTKDPRIYDPGYKFFEEKQKEEVKEEKKKSLRFADSDEDDEDSNIFSIEKKAEIVDENDTTEDKSSSSKIGKDGKLKAYLTGQVEHIDDPVEKDLAPLKALWSDPKLNDGEAFLRDYILNKKYLEEGGGAGDKLRDDDDLEADERAVEEQGKFERAYNFRFEEPDHEYLKRFPRTMSSIRPKDDTRSRRRAEVRHRKEDEKARRMAEIARLKALKLKEIQDKIARIKEVTGNDELAFKEEDIEGEFDPAEHDRRMRAIFDEQYYGAADHEKPVFPDLDHELEIENWDNYEPGEQGQEPLDDGEDEPHCEDAEFNMDADYDPKRARATLLEEIQSTLGAKRRNRKKKSKLAKLLATEKPKYIPEADKSYAEFMEEYYRMDCEDVIGGDLPTRFKYRDVVPNDYGLTVEEILLADDKELTQWVPLKRLVRQRPEGAQRGEVAAYRQKAADVALKRRVLPSLFRDLPEEPELVVPKETKKKKKKKKNKNEKSEDAIDTVEDNEPSSNNNTEQNGETTDETKKKKKKKQKDVDNEYKTTLEEGLDVENGETVDNTAKRKKKKKNKQTKSTEGLETSNPEPETDQKHNGDVNKKKKRNTGFEVENVLNVTPSQASPVPGNLKRKTDSKDTQIPTKKKKNKNITNKVEGRKHFKSNFKNKDKFKKIQNNDNTTDNPLNKLSDERLKAYGLNPKKYRSFLKYKKF